MGFFGGLRILLFYGLKVYEEYIFKVFLNIVKEIVFFFGCAHSPTKMPKRSP